MSENEVVTVYPVSRECRGCELARAGYLCSLCASLVVDSEGGRWVYLRAIENGAQGITAARSDLSPAPRLLVVE